MLVVGFEGYGGRGINPAAEIARSLDGREIAGNAIRGGVLPVDYLGLRDRLSDLIERERPVAIICLGLWPGEPMIRLERVGHNLNDFEIPDNLGTMETGPIEADGPISRPSTLPLRDIQKRLLDAGIPVRLSSSAGNFLCNAAMYTALGIADTLDRHVPCGFIHVPYLPEQVAEMVAMVKAERRLELHQRGDLASMALDMSARAVEIAVETTLDATA